MSRWVLMAALLFRSMMLHANFEETVPSRPVLLTTDEMLASAAAAVARADGPVRRAWEETLARADAALETEFVPYQDEEYLRYYRTGRDQALVIRDLAIVSRISGDRRYGERGRQLLLKWADNFHQNFDFPRHYPASEIPHASGLVIGRTILIFADAYALLWPDFAADEREQVEGWFGAVVSPIKESLRLWETGEYRGMQPPFFGRQYFNNHLGACNMGLAAIGFALRDRELIAYAMERQPMPPGRLPGEVETFNPRSLPVLIDGVIFMPGDFGSGEEGDVWQGGSGDPSLRGAPAPLPGETWDRYRVVGGSGIHYALLHLRLLTLTAEMGHNNRGRPWYDGPDYFTYLGPRGENLAVSYELYADWFVTMDPAAVNDGYYVDATPEGRPRETVERNLNALALYEVAARHYPESEPIRRALRVRDEAGDRPVFDVETFAWTATLLYGALDPRPDLLRAGPRSFALGETLYREDFDRPDPPVWVEGNAGRVRVEEGRLVLDANDPDERVLTVFIDHAFEGDLYFEYQAEILASSTATGFPEPRDVNNLNTFLYYSDPDGRDLKATRDERMDGAYSHYHRLNGYIVTFLNGHLAELRERERDPDHPVAVPPNTGRVRLRENPGFVLREEAFLERSVAGRVYRLQFAYVDGELFFFIDGRYQLSFRASPEKRADRGYFAFRTFGTEVAIDAFRVRRIEEIR